MVHKLIFSRLRGRYHPDDPRRSLRQCDDDAGYTKGTALSRDALLFSQSG
jgi:hypothetical protein